MPSRVPELDERKSSLRGVRFDRRSHPAQASSSSLLTLDHTPGCMLEAEEEQRWKLFRLYKWHAEPELGLTRFASMSGRACSKSRRVGPSFSRQYSEEVVKRLHFIQREKLLGFSLKEITDLLTLRVDGQTSCEQVKEATLAKLAQIECKLIELERMHQALLQVASLCTGEGPSSACPMLDALEKPRTI